MSFAIFRRFISGRAGERGATLVEFALAAPLTLFFFFAIIDFGRALYDYDLIANGARLGTRYAIVRGSGCTYAGCPATTTSIQDYVRSVSPGVDTSQITVTTKWLYNGTVCSSTTYPVQQNANGLGCLVNVTVSYPFTFSVLSFANVTMTSSSQMAISQ